MLLRIMLLVARLSSAASATAEFWYRHKCGASRVYRRVRQGFRLRSLVLATSEWTESGTTWAEPDPAILMLGVINQ